MAPDVMVAAEHLGVENEMMMTGTSREAKANQVETAHRVEPHGPKKTSFETDLIEVAAIGEAVAETTVAVMAMKIDAAVMEWE